MRGIGILLLVLLAAGCRSIDDAAPVGDAGAICYQRCTPSLTDTGVRWNADPEDAAAWDRLAQETVPSLAGKLLTCERARQACAGFINDLKRAGVIRARTESAPPPKPVTGE